MLSSYGELSSLTTLFGEDIPAYRESVFQDIDLKCYAGGDLDELITLPLVGLEM